MTLRSAKHGRKGQTFRTSFYSFGRLGAELVEAYPSRRHKVTARQGEGAFGD